MRSGDTWLPWKEMDWFGKVPGDLTLHTLMTHYMRNYTNDGVNPPTDLAGVNTGNGTPERFYATNGPSATTYPFSLSSSNVLLANSSPAITNVGLFIFGRSSR